MRRVMLVLVLLGLVAPVAGCVVVPVQRAGCHWVPAHFGPYGGWRPGHCA
jgi:hypothetical protein